MMPNVLQNPIAIAAVLRAGYTVVNVNPLYTPRELEHQRERRGANIGQLEPLFQAVVAGRVVIEFRNQQRGCAGRFLGDNHRGVCAAYHRDAHERRNETGDYAQMGAANEPLTCPFRLSCCIEQRQKFVYNCSRHRDLC